MSKTKISTVIPLYNKGPYIERTIKSVLNQNLQPTEIIIVNDGSTDNGPKIVENFNDSKIKLINQKNKGASAARNTGIKAAKGKLIALLDADDEWLPNHLNEKVNFFKNHPEIGAVGSSFYTIKNNEKVIPQKFDYLPDENVIINNYFKTSLKRKPMNSSVAIFKKSIIKKIGYFPENLNNGEDLFFWSKIALNYKIGYINEPSAIIHSVVNSLSDLNNIDDFPLKEYITKNNINLKENKKVWINKYVNKIYLTRIRQSIINNDKNKSKYFISKGV